MEKQVTIQELERQLAEQNAELLRVSDELKRVKDELAHRSAEHKQTEDTLRESEERFRLLVEKTHDVVYAVTPDGIVTYIGPQFAHYGYSPDEIISKHFIGFVAPEQREGVMEAFRRGGRDGTNYPTVFEWLKKDGDRVWVEVVGNDLLDDTGKFVQQIGVMRDVTERVRQEETNRSLTLLLESMDAECFIKDRDGVYTYINRAYEQQFGVKREDVIGRDDVYVFGTESAANLRENDLRIMASRQTESVEESVTLPGKGFAIYVTVKTPIINALGAVTGICGVGIDITNQKRIEDELRESEERYRDLVERISDVIYSADTAGRFTYTSPAIEPFLGYSPLEIVGRPVADFIVADDVPKSQQNLQRLTTGIAPGPNQYRVVTKAGEIRWVRVSSQPIFDGEQVSGVRGVLTDITDRVLAEEQLERAAAAAERERLSRDLHDAVTQTLFSIAAIAEVLPDMWERDQTRAQRGLQDLRAQTQGALAEMRSLLVTWRPEALSGRDLGDLMHELGDAMAARTRMPVTTTVLGECHPPTDVKLALYRIAQEALNNVVKHARAQRVFVRLQCGGAGTTLIISDDGRGFDPEGVTPDRLGMGIMRERAQAIGATYTIASKPGNGTEITVTWEQTRQTVDAGQAMDEGEQR